MTSDVDPSTGVAPLDLPPEPSHQPPAGEADAWTPAGGQPGGTDGSGWINLDPDGWLTLDDGTLLQLVDYDGDGTADISVQVYEDGWVVGRDISSADPRFELYDSQGNFVGEVDDGRGPQVEPVPGPETQEVPAPVTPEPQGIEFSVDGATYTTPPPDLDLDGDGVPESAQVTDSDGNTVIMADTDRDGRADMAFVETESGSIVMRFDGTQWVVDEDSYVPTETRGGGGGGGVVVPEQHRTPVDPMAPWQTQNLQRAMDNYAVGVGTLWEQAYPGKPWPVDDTGQPYHPNVLARVVAADDSLDPATKQLGQTFVDHWARLTQGLLPGSQAGASAVETLSDAGRCCATGGGTGEWVVPLADGTTLTLTDSDYNGTADVLVRSYPDHYVVITGADTEFPVYLTYSPSGELLRTDLAPATADEQTEPVWEERSAPEPTLSSPSVMEAEVWEDAAFWYPQEGPTCALASVVQVIEDFLGYDVNPQDVKAYAVQMGWYTEGIGIAGDGGTDFSRVDDIMAYFGVPAQELQLAANTALSQIQDWTSQGTAVITWIDASAYWSETIWPDSKGAASHAVRVLAVDFDRGVVILNDTALVDPPGRALEVPLDQFVQAMSYSNYTVVTSLGVDPDGVGATTAPASGPLSEHGFVLLPLLIGENPSWSHFTSVLTGARA